MNIILIGAPGAGKGTQATSLIKDFKLEQLSTGVMLREFLKNDTKEAKQIKEIMESGNLVPDEFIIDMIKDYIKQNTAKINGYIFDGFPRTIEQARALDGLMDQLSLKIDTVIHLEVTTAVLVDRIAFRYNCAECGAIYNEKLRKEKVPGVCDFCSSTNFTRRLDDNEQAVKERVRVYEESTKPVIDYYRQQGNLISINGTKTTDQIKKEINDYISVIN